MSRPGRKKSAGVEAVADRLHSAALRLLRRLRLQDARMGIGPAQASALSVLVFAGPMSLKELARAEQVRPPTMSRVVRGLERVGLVRRATAAADRRRIVLTPTARGKKVMLAGKRRRIATLARALRTLPENERKVVAAAAETLHALLPRL